MLLRVRARSRGAEGGDAGPTSEPRGDQEQGCGAGLESWTSFAPVVSQRRSYGHCLCDSVPHSSWDSSYNHAGTVKGLIVSGVNNNNNVHLSCAHQRLEHSHDTC